ncbi:MAG: hypothetical protein KAX84_01655 [Burkholderiales bacterium]|nr:hypothetical protein [Burkholderiales bacterium]
MTHRTDRYASQEWERAAKARRELGREMREAEAREREARASDAARRALAALGLVRGARAGGAL